MRSHLPLDIYLLHHGIPQGLLIDLWSTVDFHGTQGDSCLIRGISAHPPSAMTLRNCRIVSLAFSYSSSVPMVRVFPSHFFKYFIPEVLSPSLMAQPWPGMGLSWSKQALALLRRRSFQWLLTKATPEAPFLPNEALQTQYTALYLTKEKEGSCF